MRAFPQIATSLVLLGASLGAGSATAEPFAFRRAVDLGRPPRSAALVVREMPDGVVLEIERVRATLPIASPQHAEAQAITLAGGAKLALLRVTAANGQEAAALLGRNAKGRAEALWVGALDLRGDPGERFGYAVEIKEPTADHQAEVVIAELSERARICGQGRTLLYPRTIDPRSLELRAIELNRLAVPGAAIVELLASPQSPGPSERPLLRTLQVVAVSSQAGSSSQLGLGPPSALTDGNPATFWSEGNPGGGRGEFVTFRREGAAFPIRALAFVPLPTSLPNDSAASLLRSLWLIGEDGKRFRVSLPDAPEPGRRYWVVPDKPLSSRCLSVVIDDSVPVRPEHPGATVLAEVEAYTDLDFGHGLERLVQDLGAGGVRAGQAADLLSTLGPAVANPVQAAWPKLSAEGRRRAVRVLAGHAESDPVARATLVIALDDSDADVRKAAFGALLVAGPTARQPLEQRIAMTGQQGDAAALALARRAPQETIGPLLDALAHKGGGDRSALREAIAIACQDGGEAVFAAVRTWSAASSTDVSAHAALALALAGARSVESARTLATEILVAVAPHATAFEDRWRMVQATRALPAAPEVDAWLADLAKREEHWMLRAAALEALAERGTSQRSSVAIDALGADPYPRVRIAAAVALAKEPTALAALSEHATRDKWPMVRAAVLEALAGQPGAEAVLRKGVDDRTRQVRAAAIRALTTSADRGAWPLVEARLKDKDEWPQVVAEAVQFARALCVPAAASALLELLRHGIKPDAWAPDADNALLAFEALAQLGGASAKSAFALAESPTAPQVFRTAAHAEKARKRSACVPAR